MQLIIENIGGIARTIEPIELIAGEVTLLLGENGQGKTSAIRAVQAVITRGEAIACQNTSAGHPISAALNLIREGTALSGRARIVYEDGTQAWIAPTGTGLNWQADGDTPAPASPLSYTELNGIYANKNDLAKQWAAMISPPDLLDQLQTALTKKYGAQKIAVLIDQIRRRAASDTILETDALDKASKYYADAARKAKAEWSAVTGRAYGKKIGAEWTPPGVKNEVVEHQRGAVPIDQAANNLEIASLKARIDENRKNEAKSSGRMEVTAEMIAAAKSQMAMAAAVFHALPWIGEGVDAADAIAKLREDKAVNEEICGAAAREALLLALTLCTAADQKVADVKLALSRLKKSDEGNLVPIDKEKDAWFVCGECGAEVVFAPGGNPQKGDTASPGQDKVAVGKAIKIKEIEEKAFKAEAEKLSANHGAEKIRFDQAKKDAREDEEKLKATLNKYNDLQFAKKKLEEAKAALQEESFVTKAVAVDGDELAGWSTKIVELELIGAQLVLMKKAGDCNVRVIADESFALDLSTNPKGIAGKIMAERYALVDDSFGLKILRTFNAAFAFNADKGIFTLDGREAPTFSRSEAAMVTIAIRAIAVELNDDPLLIVDGLDIIDDVREGRALHWLRVIAAKMNKPVLVSTSTTELKILEAAGASKMPPVRCYEVKAGVIDQR